MQQLWKNIQVKIEFKTTQMHKRQRPMKRFTDSHVVGQKVKLITKLRLDLNPKDQKSARYFHHPFQDQGSLETSQI